LLKNFNAREFRPRVLKTQKSKIRPKLSYIVDFRVKIG